MFSKFWKVIILVSTVYIHKKFDLPEITFTFLVTSNTV